MHAVDGRHSGAQRSLVMRHMHACCLRCAAGVEIAHEYSEQSQGSSGWELGSDDDAATAAATAAGALASRERRQAAAAAAAGPRGRGAAGARQQRKLEHEQQGMQPGQQREDVQQGQQAAPTVPQRRLRVVDFLQPQDAEQEREEPAAAAQAGAGAAADLSRFDSGSDAEWGAPPAGATRQHLLQSRPASSGQQAMQQQVQVWPLAVARSTREEQEHSQPSGSSGSSGGSELEEWLAGAGDLGGGPAASDAEAGALNGEASSGSSGGSELEEFLATAGGDGASPEAAQEEEEGEGAGCEGKEACSDGGQHVGSGGEARTQPVAAAAADGAGRSTGGQQVRRTSQQPQQQPPQLTQQRGVVAFVEGDEAAASGRQWWHKPIPAVDLSRFASSSDEEGGGRPTALPAAVGGKRGVAHHQGAKKRRQQHMIPQVDGAADSGSDEDSASSDKDDDSESEDASTSGSEGSAGSGSDEGTSGSSTSEDAAGKDQVGEQLQKGGGASGQANAASAGHGNERSGSEGEESEEEAETADDGRAAAAAAAQEQQRQLAALFPEGAAFRRSEPLAQIEATWRVSRESWVQVGAAGSQACPGPACDAMSRLWHSSCAFRWCGADACLPAQRTPAVCCRTTARSTGRRCACWDGRAAAAASGNARADGLELPYP